ncbi:MAG: hypothetical protein ACREIP_11985 [Alphaproteobacteria bacterium]
MNATTKQIGYVPGRPAWLRWLTGRTSRGSRQGQAVLVDAKELSDHMLRDLGVLDGRNSRGGRNGAGRR